MRIVLRVGNQIILIVILLHTITINVFIDIIFSFYQYTNNTIYLNITQKDMAG